MVQGEGLHDGLATGLDRRPLVLCGRFPHNHTDSFDILAIHSVVMALRALLQRTPFGNAVLSILFLLLLLLLIVGHLL